MDSDGGKSRKDDSTTYCICKSKDDKRFMICCDGCNQWFHGDCINLKSEQAKKIKHYYCRMCQKDKKLCIEFKQKANTDSADPEPSKKKARKECGNCIGCFRTEDCGRCDICKTNRHDQAGDHVHKQKCRLRHCVNFVAPAAKAIPKRKELSKSKESTTVSTNNGAKLKNVSKKKPTSASNNSSPFVSPNHQLSSVDDSFTSPAAVVGGTTRAGAKALKDFMAEAGLFIEEDRGEELRQCLGPGCVLPARRGSKYCSDETCGLRLARNRILEILPGRLQQWNSQPTVAEEFEQKRLEHIQTQLDDAKQSLDELAEQEEKLNAWLESTKSIKWDGRTEV